MAASSYPWWGSESVELVMESALAALNEPEFSATAYAARLENKHSLLLPDNQKRDIRSVLPTSTEMDRGQNKPGVGGAGIS